MNSAWSSAWYSTARSRRCSGSRQASVRLHSGFPSQSARSSVGSDSNPGPRGPNPAGQIEIQPSAQGVAHGFRLLVDFLEHEVAVIALVDEEARRRRCDHRAIDAAALAVADFEALAKRARDNNFDEKATLRELRDKLLPAWNDAVARLSNHTRAAAELHVVQPTVSAQIKQLSVAPLLAKAIQSVHQDGSVSTLFV